MTDRLPGPGDDDDDDDDLDAGGPDDDLADDGPTCRWCHGSGRVTAAVAYVSGPDPFSGPMETVTLPTLCKPCRGTGIYEAALDPTARDDD